MEQKFDILKLWELGFFPHFSLLNSLLKLLGGGGVLVFGVFWGFFPQDFLFWWQFSSIPAANQPSSGPCPC